MENVLGINVYYFIVDDRAVSETEFSISPNSLGGAESLNVYGCVWGHVRDQALILLPYLCLVGRKSQDRSSQN